MTLERLRLPNEVIDAAESRVGTLPGEFREDIPVELRNLAFTITDINSISDINLVLASLNAALDRGETFAQWQSTVDVQSFRSLSEARQRLVFRQHMNTAFNQGKLDYARANSTLVPYLRYNAIQDNAVRDSHAALDGLTRPTNDPIWDMFTPPIDFNCRCILVALSREEAELGGTRVNQNEGAPDGTGLTPPALAETITTANPPGNGFAFNRREQVGNFTRLLRRRIRALPRNMRQVFLDRLARRTVLTRVWFDTNRELFE